MSGDNTISDWEGFDFTDHTERNLITDISRTLNNLSSESRTKHRIQKLRAELVREHIENKQRPQPLLKSLISKFFKSY